MALFDPLTEYWDWQLNARCRGAEIAEFFPPHYIRGIERSKIEAQAKSICSDCSVRPDCLSHALRCGEPYGVWGGLTASERATVLQGGALEQQDERVEAPDRPRRTIGAPQRAYLHPQRNRRLVDSG
ncbi:WhiB family transcriptional regulator [Rhodococcus sp. 1R11]|nr:WhiB family transcriptional regulator [Rhodococcus sp. 1R11]